MTAGCSVSPEAHHCGSDVQVFRLGKCVRVASYRAEESLRCHQSLHEALGVFELEGGSERARLRS